jgi:hypothetical protein
MIIDLDKNSKIIMNKVTVDISSKRLVTNWSRAESQKKNIQLDPEVVLAMDRLARTEVKARNGNRSVDFPLRNIMSFFLLF